jgi:hypothetical protein
MGSLFDLEKIFSFHLSSFVLLVPPKRDEAKFDCFFFFQTEAGRQAGRQEVSPLAYPLYRPNVSFLTCRAPRDVND